MTNQEVAKKLLHLAAALQVLDAKKYFYQIRSYQTAATVIESLTEELQQILHEKKDLEFLPGIGTAIEKKITDLIEKGQSDEIDQVINQLPQGMFPLLEIPEIGAKRAFRLATIFHLTDPATAVEQLTEYAQKGMIRSLEGFGEKSEADILENISRMKHAVEKIPLKTAQEIATAFTEYLKKNPAVLDAEALGSVRRRKPQVGDIDIGVSTRRFDDVKQWVKQYPGLFSVIADGDNLIRIITTEHIQLDIKSASPDEWGSFLQHFTGSKDHNILLREYALKMNKSLSEHGIKDTRTGQLATYATEKEFYAALQLKVIPPAKRLGKNEIPLYALSKKLAARVL